MMREIKFRGMSEGKWYYGLLTFMFGSYAVVDRKDENTVHLIDEKTGGQYTGRKDDNGFKIFQGDICVIKGEEPLYTEQTTTDYDWKIIAVVEFVDFAYWLVQNDGIQIYLGEGFDEIEIIGNIYENKELLEND